MREYLNGVLVNTKAALKLMLQRIRNHKGHPIRVGFMCQYIPAWNKAEPIYTAMLKDERFEPLIICIPSEISGHELKNPDSLENDTYDYYISNGYTAINALVGKNQWLDIASLNLDYLFFLRPYNDYMPKPYVSGALSKIVKICLILYGMCMTNEVMRIALPAEFMRNTYCYFAESEYAMKLNKGNFSLTHFLGIQKSVFLGIPAMSSIIESKGQETDIYSFAPDSFKIMWTPRWTSDLKLGGTNFFTYKDWILKYAEENSDIACLLRPHPLAFDNFISTGEMTESQVDEYKRHCQELSNVEIDTNKEYITTMWKTDVLITDISGIMPEFFIMNKPMVFCKSNMLLEPTVFTKKMLEGCYIVDNIQELETCLANLRSGKDILKEKREQIIEELFGETLYTSVSSILNQLAK